MMETLQQAASTRHGFTRAPIAIGFSNGAIMAAALLLTRPSLLAGAILFRPLSPFANDLPNRLDGKSALAIVSYAAAEMAGTEGHPR